MPDIYSAAEALKKRGFKAMCFKTAGEAKAALLEFIPPDKSIGMGGSMTLLDMGVIDALYSRGSNIISSHIAKKEGTDPDAARVDGMRADLYVTSTNALTEQGELVNTDGIGNRVAAMFYGPDTVIVVAGRNKIVKNRTAAFARIKSTASPLNAKRLHAGTPCNETGKCEDCDAKDRLCRVTVILERPPWGKDIHVFLIDEDLGY
jgi:hypothetical protein